MRVCKERETEKLISLREKFKEEFTNWYSIILVNYRVAFSQFPTSSASVSVARRGESGVCEEASLCVI